MKHGTQSSSTRQTPVLRHATSAMVQQQQIHIERGFVWSWAHTNKHVPCTCITHPNLQTTSNTMTIMLMMEMAKSALWLMTDRL